MTSKDMCDYRSDDANQELPGTQHAPQLQKSAICMKRVLLATQICGALYSVGCTATWAWVMRGLVASRDFLGPAPIYPAACIIVALNGALNYQFAIRETLMNWVKKSLLLCNQASRVEWIMQQGIIYNSSNEDIQQPLFTATDWIMSYRVTKLEEQEVSRLTAKIQELAEKNDELTIKQYNNLKEAVESSDRAYDIASGLYDNINERQQQTTENQLESILEFMSLPFIIYCYVLLTLPWLNTIVDPSPAANVYLLNDCTKRGILSDDGANQPLYGIAEGYFNFLTGAKSEIVGGNWLFKNHSGNIIANTSLSEQHCLEEVTLSSPLTLQPGPEHLINISQLAIWLLILTGSAVSYGKNLINIVPQAVIAFLHLREIDDLEKKAPKLTDEIKSNSLSKQDTQRISKTASMRGLHESLVDYMKDHSPEDLGHHIIYESCSLALTYLFFSSFLLNAFFLPRTGYTVIDVVNFFNCIMMQVSFASTAAGPGAELLLDYLDRIQIKIESIFYKKTDSDTAKRKSDYCKNPRVEQYPTFNYQIIELIASISMFGIAVFSLGSTLQGAEEASNDDFFKSINKILWSITTILFNGGQAMKLSIEGILLCLKSSSPDDVKKYQEYPNLKKKKDAQIRAHGTYIYLPKSIIDAGDTAKIDQTTLKLGAINTLTQFGTLISYAILLFSAGALHLSTERLTPSKALIITPVNTLAALIAYMKRVTDRCFNNTESVTSLHTGKINISCTRFGKEMLTCIPSSLIVLLALQPLQTSLSTSTFSPDTLRIAFLLAQISTSTLSEDFCVSIDNLIRDKIGGCFNRSTCHQQAEDETENPTNRSRATDSLIENMFKITGETKVTKTSAGNQV